LAGTLANPLAQHVQQACSRGDVAQISTSAELRWAQQEREYRADKRAANRELLKSFTTILTLLVIAIVAATVLATTLR
jgi:hypothetical protein